jgi:ribosomal protein S14
VIFKTKQGTGAYRTTPNNELPNFRAQKFLMNYLRYYRVKQTSNALRAALGMVRWLRNRKYDTQNRIAHRTDCVITGRARGISRRFNVARTKIKFFADSGFLLGVRKSSW